MTLARHYLKGESSLCKLVDFARRNPARVYAVIAAVVALVAFYVPTLPVLLILAVPAALLGIGEKVQRVEDGKTDAARSEH